MGINASGMDPELLGMALDRKRMLEQLAPLLRRVGPSHDNRSELNHANSIKRKELRRELKKNAAIIAARVMQLTTEQINDR